MPLDKQIALFLQQQADAPAPSSLEELRAQTAVGLQRLQGGTPARQKNNGIPHPGWRRANY
ncbi:hypothetical protein [Serratia fonticola]|uniref:hypothetical protein n=1 Tax=Serratia fonticola TaxID=47917 RepID=UPI0024DE05DF|nr:hypothetical protein [Serratia fonticola]MDK2375081.1 hypothetical protein [Serratia fonticola]